MKVSVLMPTYNDDKYIAKAIESVLNQQGVDVELIIINDGSNDKTEDIVLSYKDNRIKYIKQENRGQLDALLNGAKHVTGDFVCLFHSDDMITDNFAFQRNANFILKNDLDGVYSDYVLINSADKEVGLLNVAKNLGELTLKKLLQLRGANLVGDPFFVKRLVFFKNVIKNYVVWNEPYWFTIKEGKINLLKLGYMNRPWYKYRVYEGNYIRSEVGKFVAANGVMRTIHDLSKFYKVHFPSFRFVHRLPSRFFVQRVKANERYRQQVSKLITRVFKDYKIDLEKNIYYKAVLSFYNLESNTILEIDDETIKKAPLLVGKDVNIFYRMTLDGNLPQLYRLLLNAACEGSFAVKVSERYQAKIKLIFKFLNLDVPVYILGTESESITN